MDVFQELASNFDAIFTKHSVHDGNPLVRFVDCGIYFDHTCRSVVALPLEEFYES
jgi:hypothetical protein